MDNLDLDMLNRQYVYEAHSYLGNAGITSLPSHYSSTSMTSVTGIPSQTSPYPSRSTGSTSGSDLYFYDEISSDNESAYNSDQENHSIE